MSAIIAASKRAAARNDVAGARLTPAKRPTDTYSPSENGRNEHPVAEDSTSHALDDSSDAVYIAFIHESSAATAGVAYYSTATASISTTSVHCPEVDLPYIIGVMKQQLPSPVLILCTSHISEACRRELGRKTEGEEVFENAVPVKVAKNATFALDLSKQLLTAVCGGFAAMPVGHAAQLGSFIDANDAMQLRAAGGLLHWLLKTKVISDMDAAEGGGAALPGGVRMFSLTDFCQIDSLSFGALSIFARESHPALNGGGRAKEGFSLNALLDRTVSPPGKRLLRTWCLQPSLDAEVIRHRHDAVGFFMAARAQTPELWRELKSYVKKTKDLGRLLVRIKAVKAGPGDWFGLAQTVLAANMVRDHVHLMLGHVRAAEVSTAAQLQPPSTAGSGLSSLRGTTAGGRLASGGAGAGVALPPHPGDPLSESTPYSVGSPFLLRQMLREFGPELTFLQTTLDAIIDWGASREAGARGRLAVQPGLDARLDEYRRTYADLPEFLSQVSLGELAAHPSLRSLTMKYLPQIGVVVEVDKGENGLAPGTADVAAAAASSAGGAGRGAMVPMVDSDRAAAVIPPSFELCFETAEALLFKSPKARELDEYFGDIAGVICDLEASIVRQLEEKVLEYEGPLLTAGARLAEVDVLASFAEVSQDYRYVRPRIHAEPLLLVKGARHPLQELTVDTFVPNDIAMAPGRPHAGGSVSIVTGPNFSGKSVYLKTVGLIPYMAQIGCYVPAERALVGLVDRIFTRVASLESAAVAHQSTFTIDLNQMGLMLRHATPRSLLLIDEFGKGTSSVDGVALLASTIRHLLGGAALPASLPSPQSPTGGSLPPKTVITTHFREVFDFDLLGLQAAQGSQASPTGRTEGGGTTAGGGHGITGLRPLPGHARGELSLYQMQVVLDKEERAAAVAGQSAVRATRLGPGDDGDDDDARSVLSSATGVMAGGGGSVAGGGSGDAEAEDHVVPLFRLVPGRAASSYGLDCARKGGIPRHIIDRARAVTETLTSTGTVTPVGESGARARARVQREIALLAVAKALLSVPSWAASSAEDLVAALRTLHATTATR